MDNIKTLLWQWACVMHNFIQTFTVVSRKSAHGRSTLQVCQRVGWALLYHVYSHLMPLKWIIGQTVSYNEATSEYVLVKLMWLHSILVSQIYATHVSIVVHYHLQTCVKRATFWCSSRFVQPLSRTSTQDCFRFSQRLNTSHRFNNQNMCSRDTNQWIQSTISSDQFQYIMYLPYVRCMQSDTVVL